MSDVKISVIIPVGNTGEYLYKCLDTVLAQTFKDFELICVDDASSDGSYDVLQEYARKDERVKVFRQDKLGAAVARNFGIENAKGKYCMFLDSDDYFDLTLLEKTYNEAEKNQADIVIFNAHKLIDSTGEVFDNIRFLGAHNLPKMDVFSAEDVPDKIYQTVYPAPWLKLYRKDFLLEEQVKFQAISNSNDCFFFYITFATAKRICALKERLVYYRIHNSSTQGKKDKNPLCYFSAAFETYDELQRRGIYEKVRKSFECSVLSNVFNNTKSMKTRESRIAIFEMVMSDQFKKLDILGHEKEHYSLMGYRYAVLIEKMLDVYRVDYLLPKMEKPIVTIKSNSVENPLVTVVIPVFNDEAYIGQAIDSVLSQTLSNFELICVDDGSCDDSLATVVKYAKEDERITVITKDNFGLSHTRNIAMSIAKGKYIMFLDSDDMLEKNTLELLTQRAEKDDLEIVYFDAKVFSDEVDEEIDWSYSYKRNADLSDVYYGPEMLRILRSIAGYRSSACMQLISKKFLDDNSVTFCEGILHEDNAFTFETMIKAQRVSHMSEQFYLRRVRSNSIMTSSASWENCYGMFVCYRKMRNVLDNYADKMDYEQYAAADTILSTVLKAAFEYYCEMPGQHVSFEYGIISSCDSFIRLIRIPFDFRREGKQLQTKLDKKDEKLAQSQAEVKRLRGELKKKNRQLARITNRKSYKIAKRLYSILKKVKSQFTKK